ncbi:arylsulfatase [Bacteroides sp.]
MNKLLVSSLALSWIGNSVSAMNNLSDEKQPNIVLILCDDMGFSDLSCYGGEVHTPNIDFLAENGVRFSQFKNTGRSCPSRAALLTGHYQHEAGMGWMTAVDEHRPGYRGQISANLPTIAEVLRENGYATYMSGKWHVTVDGAFDKPNGSYPTQRGFEKYYGCLAGGGSYYTPKPLYYGLEPVTQLPDDFYYTTAITDSAVSFIQQHPENLPMFLYVAHFAPHLPLHAPKERVEACRERYKVGYDALRRERFERQKELGLVDKSMELPVYQREFKDKRPAWESLSPQQQEQWITDMATYAAMIEIMDDGIGELIRATKEKGIYENTVFLFMSDNGSTNEGGYLGQLMADLSNTPYRSYKQWCFQGGTSSPLIVKYGDDMKNKIKEKKGSICREACHIIDLFPTCLDIASVKYPSAFSGKKVKLSGTSLVPALQNKKVRSRDLFFEHQTSCAIISENWKLVRANGKVPWELINLSTDPFEEHDLSAQYPEKVKALEKKWNRWAEQQHVFPFEYRPWTERINYYKGLYPNQRGE